MPKNNKDHTQRAGRWAREQSRYEQLRWLKKRWTAIAPTSGGILAVCIGLLAFRRDVMMGITVGVILTSWVWALALLVLQNTGTASTLMGAEAETWTAEELRKMTRQGWRVFDAVPIDGHNRDVDHLALCGAGVFAFETKWSGSDWFSERQSWYLDRQVEQARQRAADFARMRTGFELKGTPVMSVLVLWGPFVDDLPAADRIRECGEVTVVAGPWLTEWAAGLSDERLGSAEIDRAAGAVERFLEMREPHFRGPDRGRFVGGGLYGVFSDVRNGVLAALAAALVVSYAAAFLGKTWLMFFLIAAAIASVSWLAWLKLWHFPVVLGWAAGATAALPLAGSWWLAGVLG